jgi:hypothetical protein
MPCGVGGNWAIANEEARAMLLANHRRREAIGKLEREEDSRRPVLSMETESTRHTEYNVHSDGGHLDSI